MGAVEPFFPLLALCARARAHPAQTALLREHTLAIQPAKRRGAIYYLQGRSIDALVRIEELSSSSSPNP
jgi:hypothetical protein